MSKLGLSSLRDLFQKADGPEGFEELPATLEYVLQSIDSKELHPTFRADIHDLLLNSVNLCATLSDPTYDTSYATKLAARIHEVVARVVTHLANRPTNKAFGILFPRTSTLHSDIFASEGEASAKLAELSRIGLREAGEIVPVAIVSDRVAQPKAPKAETTEQVMRLEAELKEQMKG